MSGGFLINGPDSVKIYDANGNVVNVQNPFPSDGDSVYCKDIWVDESNTTDWIDEDGANVDIACIPFTNLYTRIKNSTANNPKILRIHFNRTIFANQVGFGCVGVGESFSNVLIKALGSGGVERIINDESSNNTKYTSRNYVFGKQELFNAIEIEFATVDPVCLSNITIQKITEVSVGQVERTTNSLKTISYSHAELHSGSHYVYRESHIILKAGILDHLIVTPDTERWSHMTIAVESVTSTVSVEIFEGVTAVTDGNLENARNRNRNFLDNNTTLIYEDPTGIAGDVDANSLGRLVFGAGKNSAGGGIRDTEEILLKQNTKYLVRVAEQNLDTTIANLIFDWYEHTNKSEPES